MRVIYAITHLATGRQYIGSTVNFRNRKRSHLYRLGVGTHRNPKLQAAWNKHGSDAFEFTILEEVPDGFNLLEREQRYLDSLKPHYYNIAVIAGNPMQGRKQSARFIELLSARGKGKPRPPEVRAKIAATLRGRKLGPRSDAVKHKLSEKLKGHAVSADARARIGAKNTGRRHSDEARAKIGAYSRAHGVRPKPKPGVANHQARLTWASVREIRAKYATGKYTLTGLGTEYGVDHSTIGLIVRNKTWREDCVERNPVVDSTYEPMVPRLRRIRARS